MFSDYDKFWSIKGILGVKILSFLLLFLYLPRERECPNLNASWCKFNFNSKLGIYYFNDWYQILRVLLQNSVDLFGGSTLHLNSRK